MQLSRRFTAWNHEIIKYTEITKLTLKNQMIYKWDVWLKGLFAIIRIFLFLQLWTVIYSERTEVSGLTFQMMITYYLVNSFFKMLDCSNSIVTQLSNDIREGHFSKYKIKPMNIMFYFMFNCFAKSIFNLVINIPSVCIWILLFHKYFELSLMPITLLWALVINSLGLLFMILFNYFVGLLSFRFIDISAANIIKNTVIEFLVGSFVPLVLVHSFVQEIMKFFPFYYISYLPSMLLIGKNQSEIRKAIIVLLCWIFIMFCVNKIAYNLLQKKYEGVGI